MASKNQLLGHGNVEEKVKSEEPTESLMLYRADYPQGREFPPDMIKMMKYKGWREQPFEEPAENKSTQDKASFFDIMSDEKD